MAERSFEAGLERLFTDAPMAPDAQAFADGVVRRLDREMALRRFLIGGLGLAGGLVAGVQLLRWGPLERLPALIDPSNIMAVARLGQSPAMKTVSGVLSGGTPLDLAVMMALGGLALLAAGLVSTRAFRAF